jgi:cyclic pyranopterin phosphate synthase
MTKEDLVIEIRNRKIPLWLQKILYQIYIWLEDTKSLIKFGDRYFFRNAAIEISTKCNRQCGYCPNSKYPTVEKYMTEKTFDKSIASLKEIGFEGSLYLHFYNEPLLDKRLAELVARAKKELPKAMIRIFTNGDFLDEKMTEKLVEAGVMEFVITYHKPESKDFRTRMELLKKKWGNYLNLQSLDDTPLSNRGGLIYVANQEVRKNCIEPLRTVQIDLEGNVVLCCNDFFRVHKFGNIQKESLREIWDKKSFQKLRKELRWGVINLPICRKCLNTND